MMGIMVPETCWASNKICNKNSSVACSWNFISTYYQRCTVKTTSNLLEVFALHHPQSEGRIEVKRRQWIRCKQLLYDVKETKRYWKFKEETLHSNLCKTSCGGVCVIFFGKTNNGKNNGLTEWMNECVNEWISIHPISQCYVRKASWSNRNHHFHLRSCRFCSIETFT